MAGEVVTERQTRGANKDALQMSAAWEYTTSKLPENQELMATISNGFVGHRILSDTIYAAGIFNGDSLSSHRARIPCSLPTKLYVESVEEEPVGAEERLYTLDARNAVFLQTLSAADKSYFIKQTTYAHRYYKNLLITELKVVTTRDRGISITMQNNMGKPSCDITFSHERFKDFSIMCGSTNQTEGKDVKAVEVAVVYSPPNDKETLHVEKSSNWKNFYFVTAISSSLEGANPKARAIEEFSKASEMIKDYDKLWKAHQNEWEKLWKTGSVTADGDLPLSQAINSSLYFIVSSLRASWPYGLSPGGLPSNGYLGHTFWDQATWMFPALLLFHPDLAKSCLEYRFIRAEAAKERAKQNGFKGTMFPWESAFSGVEVCPEPDPYSKYEHHIVGDIGFAAQQYWMATHDSEWFLETGRHLIEGAAEFWTSRVVFDSAKNEFVINHVQGPDEYHYNVNNSVYTNVIAKINLEFAVKIFQKFDIPVPSSWSKIASNMYVPFDATNNYHPEFDGYQLKTVVKQADVILLGYPLMYDMTTNVRRNDLAIYEACTDPEGPAMTKAMFAIGWLELKEFSKASFSFKEAYANVTEPFKVWTETPSGGEVNFITGAGGFLQSVLFGYGGIRLKINGLQIEPQLPDNLKQLSFNGITYLGNKIKYSFDSQYIEIEIVEQFHVHHSLLLITVDKKEEFNLELGKVCKILCCKAFLKKTATIN